MITDYIREEEDVSAFFLSFSSSALDVVLISFTNPTCRFSGTYSLYKIMLIEFMPF